MRSLPSIVIALAVFLFSAMHVPVLAETMPASSPTASGKVEMSRDLIDQALAKPTKIADSSSASSSSTSNVSKAKFKKLLLMLGLGCLVATAIAVPVALCCGHGGGSNNNSAAQKVALLYFYRQQQIPPPVPRPAYQPPIPQQQGSIKPP